MRQVREVLRLKWEQRYSDRKVALACHLSRPAIKTTVARALAAGLSWAVAWRVRRRGARTGVVSAAAGVNAFTTAAELRRGPSGVAAH